MTNFYSYVEPLSKYSPVMLHLSPATRILNENLNCTIFLIILTAGRIGKNGRRGRNVKRKRAYGQSLTGHAKRDHVRGGEWYLEKHGSRKILAGSRNLGSAFDKSRSLVFAWFVFTFFQSLNFFPKSLGLGFLTRISASRRVSDFTIRHPSCGL